MKKLSISCVIIGFVLAIGSAILLGFAGIIYGFDVFPLSLVMYVAAAVSFVLALILGINGLEAGKAPEGDNCPENADG